MRKLRYRRRQSRSAVWALRLGLFATVLLALAFLLHRFWRLETPDLVAAAGVSGVLALLALACAARAFRNLWADGDEGGVRAFWACIFACAVLVPLGLVGALWYASPPLYDLSTDFDTPPEFPPAMPARLPWMNPLTPAVSGDALTQLTAYPDVLGRRYDAAPDRVAAILIEPVQGDGGFLPAPADFMQALREIATRHGIVLIADEIQTGFGRTGTLFGFENSGIQPDLVTVAKSLAGGFPISGLVGRAEMMDAPTPGGLGGTYGGNAVACAAGRAGGAPERA